METCLAPFQALLYIMTVIARLALVRMTTITRSSSRAMDRTRLCILCSAHVLACNYSGIPENSKSFFFLWMQFIFSYSLFLTLTLSPNSHRTPSEPLTLILAALLITPYPLHCIHSSLLFDPRIYNNFLIPHRMPPPMI